MSRTEEGEEREEREEGEEGGAEPAIAPPARPGSRSVLVHWLGLTVVALSLAFVGWRIHQAWDELLEVAADANSPGLIAVLSLAYGAMGFLLSGAWFALVAGLDAQAREWSEASRRRARSATHRLYARSQIAKYVPGNVMQLVKRHALARALGTAHSALAAAALYEVMGLVLAAGALALFFLVGEAGWSTLLSPLFLVVAVVVSLCGMWAVPRALGRLRLAHRLPERLRRATRGLRILEIGAIARAEMRYLLFFALGGSLLAVLVASSSGQTAPGLMIVSVASYALSWITGFLTPGAPAGLGVREALLVAVLTPALGGHASSTAAEAGAIALLCALSLRLVTVLGDLVFFATSLRPHTSRLERPPS